jgi:hypothetical protein
MTSRREARPDLFAPGDLPGAVSVILDEQLLLKVSASGDEIRFDPATPAIRADFRATIFGKKLEYPGFPIAGWSHRPYTDDEWAHLDELFADGNRQGLTGYRPRREKGIDVLEWPILMKESEQKFPDAFAMLVRVLGPEPQLISVNGFSQLKKEALWQLLQTQRKSGKVDPALEVVTHWSV